MILGLGFRVHGFVANLQNNDYHNRALGLRENESGVSGFKRLKQALGLSSCFRGTGI